MVFKRLWRYLKKTFRKKRARPRKRTAPKHRKKQVKRSTPSRKNSTKKNISKRTRIRVPPKKAASLKKTPGAARLPRAQLAGTVTHYFPKVNAAVVKLKKSLRVGQPVLIKGPKTQVRQTVGSMQINREPIESAKAGQEIGLEVFKEVRPGDMVFLLEG